jgi:ribulose kinase
VTACVLGVDVGTEAVRAVLVDPAGLVRGGAAAPVATAQPMPGRAEQDPHAVWDALLHAVAAVGNADVRVVGVALASTSVTAVAVGADDEPVGPAILWMDTRAAAEAEEIGQTGHRSLWYTGGRVSPEWMLPKVLWLSRHEPQRYSSAIRVVELHDWLVHRLTGQWAAGVGFAASGWSFVPALGGWPVDLLQELAIDGVLAGWPEQPLQPGQPVGRLRAQAAAALGLDADVVVGQGTMDTFAAALACNVQAHGRTALSLGTSSAYVTLMDEPRSDPRALGPVPDAFGPETWTMYAGQTSAGSVLRWFQRELAGGISLTDLDAEAARIPIGSEGVRALDTFQGSRSPHRDPSRTGALWGLRLSHRRGSVYRALMEAVALGGREIVAAYTDLGIEVRELVACGGGARSPVWMQMHADATGRTIAAVESADAAALGAAICAAVGAGMHESLAQAATAMTGPTVRFAPLEDATARYARLADDYREVAALLAGLTRSQ